jgi:hypothetical protein
MVKRILISRLAEPANKTKQTKQRNDEKEKSKKNCLTVNFKKDNSGTFNSRQFITTHFQKPILKYYYKLLKIDLKLSLKMMSKRRSKSMLKNGQKTSL